MTPLRAEVWLLRRDRAALFWLAVMALLSVIAVAGGLEEVAEQRATIERLQASDAAERTRVAKEQTDWGGLAYYSFHLTFDPPSDFAFAALGQRDVASWKHRIRLLALEGQIYETDADNPALALVGRLDFAFVASMLLPLFVFFLLHGIRSEERAAGRWRLLVATARQSAPLWRRRALVRLVPLLACLLGPLVVGAAVESASIWIVALACLAIVAHALVWAWVTDQVSRRVETGAVALTVLVGIWMAVAVVIPAGTRTLIESALPVPQGANILLAQREAVNGAWDLPKAATMEPFLERHPELTPHSQVSRPFEWKWYYAFQQVGDQRVEQTSLAYRFARTRRDDLAGWCSSLSPPALVERSLQRLARTDPAASRAYEQTVRDFHAALRRYYYPKIFRQDPVDAALVAQRPEFSPPG